MKNINTNPVMWSDTICDICGDPTTKNQLQENKVYWIIPWKFFHRECIINGGVFVGSTNFDEIQITNEEHERIGLMRGIDNEY